MQLAKEGKVCLECSKDLARYWGRSFCEPCLRKLLKEQMEEEDKRHANRISEKV